MEAYTLTHILIEAVQLDAYNLTNDIYSAGLIFASQKNKQAE